MTVAFRAFTATFVATPAVFAKLAFHITNTAVYTMCTVVHSTLNTHMAFVTPRIIAFYATFADIAPYYFVVNIAQIAAGAHHVIIKVTFIAHMVLSLTAFTAAFITASAIYTNSVINLTSTALIAMTFVVHRTGTAHMALFAPIVCTASALTAVLTMVFLVAVSSAFFAAVVAALAYVIITTERAAVIAVNLGFPCMGM